MVSTADLIPTQEEHQERLNNIRGGLSDQAVVAVVEWRKRADELRQRAQTFLNFILLALFIGMALVLTAHLLVIALDVKLGGTPEIELIKKRKTEALEQLKQAATILETRRMNIIKEMEELLRGGGKVWHQVHTDTSANLWAMHFSDKKITKGKADNQYIGWIAGDEGTILQTIDLKTWTKAKIKEKQDFWEMHFVDDKIGWVIGRGGGMYHTVDGKNWTKVVTGVTEDLSQLHFADTQTGWVIGEKGTILHTADGVNWQRVDVTASNDEVVKSDLRRMHFANAKTGWIIGKEGTILQTVDGKDWKPAKITWLNDEAERAGLWDMRFANATTGWVIGNEGTILYTVDGIAWQQAKIEWLPDKTGTVDLWGIHFTSDKIGWAVGNEGTILHTVDGEKWVQVFTPTIATLGEIHFTDERTGWAIGREGTILYTTDGTTWNQAVSDTTATLGEMHFADAKTGWIIGFGGTVLHTTNGVTWTKADSGTTVILTAVHFPDAQTGWAIGFGGVLLATRKFDVTLVDLAIGQQIKLARDTPLKDIFKDKGYLDDLQNIATKLKENQMKQDSIYIDIKAFEKRGAAMTASSPPSTQKPEEGIPGTRFGNNNTFDTFFLQTTIIRITAILLIVFLVQILTGLYRYNTRLAGFYDARADAILVVEFSGMRFDKLVELLSPDHLTFGRQPKSPANSAVDLAREILRGDRSRS